MTLRDYQTDTVARIRDAFRRHRRVLYTLPTGGGKTVLFAHMVRRAAERGKRCAILVHRAELLRQASAKLGALPHGLVKAGITPNRRELVQIASVQTLVRRLHKYAFDFVVVDEAHHTPADTYRRILDANPDAFVLGVTATPCRTDGQGLADLFDALILGPSVDELTKRGFLAPAAVYAPSQINTDGVHTVAGDFKRSELEIAVDKPRITGDAIAHYRRYADGLPSIAFCTSVRHAEHVAEQFRMAGYRARRVDGGTPDDEREAAIAGLADGRVQVLTSCDLISEGVDVPVVACGIFLRPTQSLGLFLQQVGRILRPAPGKDCAIILDHAGNCVRHKSLPDTPQEWTLAGRPKRKRGAQEDDNGPVRVCPACFAVFASAPRCPACGHVYETKSREIEAVEGELVLMSEDLLRRRKQEQGRAQTLEELVALGRKRGYKHPYGWALHVIRARCRAAAL